MLVLFGGITDRLIPLFAVGAFLSFTLSQAGMAMHWRREGNGQADRLRLGINGLGALATGMALAIILAAKFTEGACPAIIDQTDEQSRDGLLNGVTSKQHS